MTRKDFALIAKTLNESLVTARDEESLPDDMRQGRTLERLVIRNTALALANAFASEYPRFDRARFLAAAIGD